MINNIEHFDFLQVAVSFWEIASPALQQEQTEKMNRMFQNFCCLGSNYILSDDNQRKDVLKVKADSTADNANESVKTGNNAPIPEETNGNTTDCSKLISKVSCCYF